MQEASLGMGALQDLVLPSPGSQAQGSILRQTRGLELISGERQSVVYKLYPFQIEMRVKMQLTWSFCCLWFRFCCWFCSWPRCYGHRFMASSILIISLRGTVAPAPVFTVCAHIKIENGSEQRCRSLAWTRAH